MFFGTAGRNIDPAGHSWLEVRYISGLLALILYIVMRFSAKISTGYMCTAGMGAYGRRTATYSNTTVEACALRCAATPGCVNVGIKNQKKTTRETHADLRIINLMA